MQFNKLETKDLDYRLTIRPKSGKSLLATDDPRLLAEPWQKGQLAADVTSDFSHVAGFRFPGRHVVIDHAVTFKAVSAKQ